MPQFDYQQLCHFVLPEQPRWNWAASMPLWRWLCS